MKIIEVIVHINKFEKFIIKIIGKINAISTSKIKKIIVIKKNFKEKGIREEDIGSNPHSNGDLFSRSEYLFLDKIVASIITTIDNKIIINDIKVIEKIIYIIKINKPYDWKSYILLYYINKLSSSSINWYIKE